MICDCDCDCDCCDNESICLSNISDVTLTSSLLIADKMSLAALSIDDDRSC